MYRAVALWAIRQAVELSDMHRLDELAKAARIELDSVRDTVVLNGEDVTEAIRADNVSAAASQVACGPGRPPRVGSSNSVSSPRHRT